MSKLQEYDISDLLGWFQDDAGNGYDTFVKAEEAQAIMKELETDLLESRQLYKEAKEKIVELEEYLRESNERQLKYATGIQLVINQIERECQEHKGRNMGKKGCIIRLKRLQENMHNTKIMLTA